MITALAHILLSFGLAVGGGVACVLAWRQIVDWNRAPPLGARGGRSSPERGSLARSHSQTAREE